MTIKNDRWIRESGILTPCYEFTNTQTVFEEPDLKPYTNEVKIISKGISSYGYDLTCHNEFKVFRQPRQCYAPTYNNIGTINESYYFDFIDPKNIKGDRYILHKGDYCIIPPNSFVLTRSVEYFKMPRNIVGICMGKSTYARCGLVANTTLIEPEWEGHLVIELSNTTPSPVKVYANEGIVQVVFMEANDLCEVSYADRKGKYQGQTEIQEAKV